MPDTPIATPDIVVLDVTPEVDAPKKKRARTVSIGVKRAKRTKAQTQVTLTEMAAIKRLARERKQRAADVVRDAITAYLKKYGTP